jgi:hypothetical protein
VASSKNKALLNGAITVAVLAVVLIVLGMIGPLFKSHKATTPAAVTSNQSTPESLSLYGQALAAQQSGDLNRAADLARAAVAADPNNTEAKKLLTTLTASSSSGSSGGSSGGGSTNTTSTALKSVYVTKIKDLTSLLPTAFPDYDLMGALQVLRDASVTGQPSVSNGVVANITWTVHDRSSVSKAKSFITKTSKSAYAHDSATVAAGGTTAYFGTDGTKFATVVFTRGRYAFEVILTAIRNDPAATKDAAIRAADAFPALPVK